MPVPCDSMVSTFFTNLFSSSVFLFPLDRIDEDEEGHSVTMVFRYLPVWDGSNSGLLHPWWYRG